MPFTQLKVGVYWICICTPRLLFNSKDTIFSDKSSSSIAQTQNALKVQLWWTDRDHTPKWMKVFALYCGIPLIKSNVSILHLNYSIWQMLGTHSSVHWGRRREGFWETMPVWCFGTLFWAICCVFRSARASVTFLALYYKPTKKNCVTTTGYLAEICLFHTLSSCLTTHSSGNL